jgi:PilZ domain-containing protein
MERRAGTRKAMDVEVTIDSAHCRAVRGKIGNVGFGGLFVQLEAGGLREDARVEILVVLSQETGSRLYRMPAVVARITQNGAGLIFDEYDVTAFRTLVLLLLARQKAVADSLARGATFSDGRGSDAAPTLGDANEAAATAGSFAPMSQQPSPA